MVRIEDGHLVLDPRTVAAGEESKLLDAVCQSIS
jgi:hypothetical protein